MSKYLLTLTALLGVVSITLDLQASELKGNLVCFPMYMTREAGIVKPPLFIAKSDKWVASPYEFRMDLEDAVTNRDDGFLGPRVAFSIDEALTNDEVEKGRLKNITLNRHTSFDRKNDKFSGRVLSKASPLYDSVTGEIYKVKIKLAYQKKSWGKYKNLALAEVQVPASAFENEGEAVKVRIESNKSGQLRYFEVSCFRSNQEVTAD